MNRKDSLRREKAVRLCRKAKLYFDKFDKENFSKAADLLRRSLEIDPTYFYAYFLTALVIRDENPQGAIDYLRKSVAYDPRFQQSWYYLGATLARSKDTLEEGLHALEKAHDLDPRDVWTIIALANRYAYAEDADRSHEFYQKAIDLEPDNEQFKVWFHEMFD